MSEAKKSLGQHWLEDRSILQAIVAAGDISSHDNVLEIGPGKGTLTRKLLDTGAHVHALEFDTELLPFLKSAFSMYDNFIVTEGDIRKFDYSTMKQGYKVVANIPYYLTSNLIRAISETVNPPAIAVLLIQKEVAKRLCAGPGQMGILSVTAQFYFTCELGVEVPARYFSPPPKVDSQVVIMTRRKEVLFPVDERKFFQFVKAGFSEKRKTLRNSLSGGLGIPKDTVEKLLQSSKIHSTARAQELSLAEWNTLYLNYESHGTSANE
jgi:16S rRNA (adenine1518-N6/adenine1519-N6)-dimethyltransferase